MTKLTLPLLTALVATFMMHSVHAEENVILKGSEKLESGERIYAQHRNCRLSLQHDANLVVKRRVRSLDDDDDEWKVSWASGAVGYGSDFEVEFNDGNLEIYDEDRVVVWSTNLVKDVSSDDNLELVMDGACRLKLLQDGKDVWANIKTSLRAGQVLQKGEMLRMPVNFGQFHEIQYPFSLDYVMILQGDCNLVQHVGTDMGDEGSSVWTSDTVLTDADNCYFYLDKGRAVLYEGTFDPKLGFEAHRPGEYWSTPDDWFDTSFYSDQIQENYEIVLNSDGTLFGWRSLSNCGAPPHETHPDTSCAALTSDTNHANSYWDKDQFTCRMNKRPCNVSPFEPITPVDDDTDLFIDLGDAGGTLNFETGTDNGAGEVWIVHVDKNGKPLTEMSNACARFRGEGHEYKLPEFEVVTTWDVNDYEPGSLECCGPRDDDDRMYIIIDGVLVDSCPKSVIESCLSC